MDTNEENFMEKMHVNMAMIMNLKSTDILHEYDEKIFLSLAKKDYVNAEEYLSELCFLFTELPEEQQLFSMRNYFISIVSDAIKSHRQNGRLHPLHIASSYALISTIDSWKTTSAFLSSIGWFVHKVITNLIPGIHFLIHHPTLEKILDLIHDHLTSRKLSVSWLAKQMGFTTARLTSTFKNAMDESVSHYIQRQKVEEIAFELRFTAKPLKDICQSFGYDNVSNFIRTFKGMMGTTPLKYRQEYM